MKSYKFLLLAAMTTGMWAACSDDDNSGVDDPAVSELGGDGYVCLSINLPSTTGTRSDNDDFDDGLNGEYGVKDAWLLLFKGTSESDATLEQVYDIYPAWSKQGTTTDQVTVTSQIVQRIYNNLESSQKYFAYVILNAPSELDLSSFSNDNPYNAAPAPAARTRATAEENGGNGLKGKKLNEITPLLIGSITPNPAASGSGASIPATRAAATSSAPTLETSQNIVKGLAFIPMNNAPLAKYRGWENAPGTDGTIETMPVIDPTKIFNTVAEAQNKPACDIYVQRMYAKVTVHTTFTDTDTEQPKTTVGQLSFKLTGWLLDNTHKGSYLGQQVGESNSVTWYNYYSDLYNSTNETSYNAKNLFRFVGSTPVNADNSPTVGNDDGTYRYRVYWAKDPDYGGDSYTYNGANFDTIPAVTDATNKNVDYQVNWGTVGSPQYCFENTFDVARQAERYTTRVLVRAKFKDGNGSAYTDGFYTVDGNSSHQDSLFDKTGIEERIKAVLLNDGEIAGYIMNQKGLTQGDLSKIVNGKEGHNCTIALDYGCVNYKNNANYTAGAHKAPGYVVVKRVMFDDVPVITEGSDLATKLTKTLNIQYYANGNAYYRVLIKHFGDELTPWYAEDHTTGKSYIDNSGTTTSHTSTTVGSGTIDRYTGRYGMLRNNWYDIEINGVKALGSPTIPTLTDEWDDEVESYIAVKINILSWAKRKQTVTLE